MYIVLITGKGPKILTDIGGLKPYVKEKKIIHIGQRDEEKTVKYRSTQIQKH